MKIGMIAVVLSILLCGCDMARNFGGQASDPGGQAADSTIPQESDQAPMEEMEPSDTELEIPPLQTMTLTVPEGYTLARIAMTLEEMGICQVQQFIDATQTGDFSEFPLVAGQVPDENRCFRLEGYLFPDTYQIYADDPPEAIVRRMLEHLEAKMSTDLRGAIAESGYTFDQVLALASIIEKESFGPEQMPAVSSVLHNRLNAGMQLQCDVTITYVEGAIKPFIEGDKDRYNEYYNTYKCPAIPAGAICNPGLDAIWAAVTPADTDYLFFVTDGDKNYYYAATWEGHLENIQIAGIGQGAPEQESE